MLSLRLPSQLVKQWFDENSELNVSPAGILGKCVEMGWKKNRKNSSSVSPFASYGLNSAVIMELVLCRRY